MSDCQIPFASTTSLSPGRRILRRCAGSEWFKMTGGWLHGTVTPPELSANQNYPKIIWLLMIYSIDIPWCFCESQKKQQTTHGRKLIFQPLFLWTSAVPTNITDDGAFLETTHCGWMGWVPVSWLLFATPSNCLLRILFLAMRPNRG